MSSQRQHDLLLRPLVNADDLHRWVRLFCNLNVPRAAVCEGHQAPFDYLVRAYFEPATDQVVHAPRGGGKTRLAAVATLLDLLHKPGVSVRVLGGSLEQSLRLWEHLLPDLTHVARDLINKGKLKTRRIELSNGSTCAVLAQSERSIRGVRVQKLRCDEVELFKPEVWEAAQLVTKSRKSGVGGRRSERATHDSPPTTHTVHGSIDALSTFHEPFGLMQKILDAAATNGTPIVRWSVLDVLERCPPERECASCPLFDDCGGIAKARCNGFVSVDDAIRMKKRVSLDVWQAEMLCKRPSTRQAVFPGFDVAKHVREAVALASMPTTSYAIDFGFAGAFACLCVQSDGTTTFVFDEHVHSEMTLEEHLNEIAQKGWPRPAYVACDPAGAARNSQTGLSDVQTLRRAGYSVRYRASGIADGVEAIRGALRPALGEPRLFIHPRCARLIRAMQAYRYPAVPSGAAMLPIKDGVHDHPIDALRYHFANVRSNACKSTTY